MPPTNEKPLPFTVNRQANTEKDLIEVGLITGQKLYMSPGTARMLACDLIQAAYQAEMQNQQRAIGPTPKDKTATPPLSIVATA